MFLITQLSYEALYGPEGLLKIRPFSMDDFDVTKFYFHLGAARINDKVELLETELTIPPGEFVRVFSLETFSLTRRVLGMIGQCSELFNQGLELVHSPTIDPGYSDKVLTLGLRNNEDVEKHIRPGSRIGKAVFFDISDSILDNHDLVKQKVESAEDKIKKAAADRLLQAGIDIQGVRPGPLGISANNPEKI